MMMRVEMRTAAALLAALALSACGGEGGHPSRSGAGSEQISIDGSSTVYPLAEAAAEAFSQSATGGARITVGENT
jgi:phosphate transport system substrate-binding protein